MFALSACPAIVRAADAPAAPAPKAAPDYSARILTPPPAAEPRINGPKVYGQRPGRPFLYMIPATGERPMSFVAVGLPEGLTLDPQSGRISGVAPKEGEY